MYLRRCTFLLILAVCAGAAQTAVVNGKTVSLADLQNLAEALPQQLRDKPDEVFRYYGFVDRMAAKGEAAKLAEQSPYKEQLELARKQVMAQAAMDRFYKDLTIPEDELKKYYEDHKADFVDGFQEGRAKIWRTIADARFAAWMDELRKSVTVTK